MSWETVKLGQVIKLEYGKGLSEKDRFFDGAHPAFGANGIKSRTNLYLYDKPSIIVGRKGSAGELTLVSEKFWALDVSYYLIHDQSKTDLRYLYFALLTKNLPKFARGVKPGINRNDIYELEIPLPPLSVQQKIVTKLDAIFTEIDKATAAAEANIKNAEALFQSYLTEVFERGGEGFFKTTIGESCILRSGTTVNADLEQKEGDLPYLKVADMNLLANQECIVTSSRFLNFKIVNKNSVIKKGSTIFPKRGGAIDTNKKRIVDVDITVDLNIMSVFPNQPIEPYLLYFYFLSLDMKKLGSGSSIRQINNYDIEPLVFSYPTNSEMQKTLINKLKGCKNNKDNLISNYESKKLQLNALKQSILQQAFNGELIKE